MTKIAPAPPSVLDFSRRCLFSPSQAAESAKAPGSLSPALAIYAAFLLASAAFYAWKPFDFPDRNAPFPRETQNLWFWLKAMLYQPPLEFAWVAFLVALLEWFREGRLFWRILGAVIATALPFGLLIAYQQNSLGWGIYFTLATAWVAECHVVALQPGPTRPPSAVVPWLRASPEPPRRGPSPSN